jgi:phage RecT family recombinase
MSNELALFENQLKPLTPRFADVLGKLVPVERLIQTAVISAERTPGLLQCDRQSLLNGIMTFAVLALEIDGATGQGFLIPFNDRRRGLKVAQPVIGYKGYNTLGARSGHTIAGGVVREGDEVWDYDEGSKPFVHHKRKLGGEKDRRIIAAWATATSFARPPIVKVLSIDELMAVKAKSPRGGEPPWADPAIGFPAMCEKTAKRRLARDMPLNVFQAAARMEEAFEEQGAASWINPDKGVIVDGEVIAPREASPTPTFEQLTSSAGDAADQAAPVAHPPEAQAGAASVFTDVKWGMAQAAAMRGRDALVAFARDNCTPAERKELAAHKAELEALYPAVAQ